ncbi:MAG: hypothetical protein ACI9PN_001817, partial [Candidatus Azotimanducaceae bacterium]
FCLFEISLLIATQRYCLPRQSKSPPNQHFWNTFLLQPLLISRHICFMDIAIVKPAHQNA